MLLWTELVKNHTNLHNKYPFPFYVFPEQKYKSNDSEYLWKTCKRHPNTLCVCVCGEDVFKHLQNVFHATLICLSRQIRLLFYLFPFCIKLLFKQFYFKEVLQMVYTQMIFFNDINLHCYCECSDIIIRNKQNTYFDFGVSLHFNTVCEQLQQSIWKEIKLIEKCYLHWYKNL